MAPTFPNVALSNTTSMLSRTSRGKALGQWPCVALALLLLLLPLLLSLLLLLCCKQEG